MLLSTNYWHQLCSMCSCRIWVFSSQHLCLRGWGWTSSWKIPSCPAEWNWTERLLVVWLTCLDRCQVWTLFFLWPFWPEHTFFLMNTDILVPPPGSGIGTGPGVIQDRYSPTMGRHRTNPLFNGHSGHIAPPPQSQFDMGPKPFVKSNQVILPAVEIIRLTMI